MEWTNSSFRLINILLLECCNRFSFTLKKWYSLLAKILIPPITIIRFRLCIVHIEKILILSLDTKGLYNPIQFLQLYLKFLIQRMKACINKTQVTSVIYSLMILCFFLCMYFKNRQGGLRVQCDILGKTPHIFLDIFFCVLNRLE